MLRHPRIGSRSLTLLGLLAIAGCGADGVEPEATQAVLEEAAVEDGGDEDKADRAALTLTVVPGVGNPGSTEVRRTFTSAASYTAFFGAAPPAAIDFSREWATFYGAGSKNTGGYAASVTSVRLNDAGTLLKVTTRLDSPGPGCRVTYAFTNPSVLVKYRRPVPRPASVRYYRADTTRNCDPCAVVRCAAGTHCVASGGSATCEPDTDPCALVRCANGTTCVATNGSAQCVLDAGRCLTDSDCVLWDNYCGGCACDVLGHNQRPVTCTDPVACFVQPCLNKTAYCNATTATCGIR